MASIKWNVLMPDNCQPSERLCNCRFHCSISLRGCATHGVGAHMAKRCHGCHFWTILIYARIAPSSSKVWVTLLLPLWEKYSYYIHTHVIFSHKIYYFVWQLHTVQHVMQTLQKLPYYSRTANGLIFIYIIVQFQFAAWWNVITYCFQTAYFRFWGPFCAKLCNGM